MSNKVNDYEVDKTKSHSDSLQIKRFLEKKYLRSWNNKQVTLEVECLSVSQYLALNWLNA